MGFIPDIVRILKHVIKELAPNMWLRIALDKTKMADNVSVIPEPTARSAVPGISTGRGY